MVKPRIFMRGLEMTLNNHELFDILIVDDNYENRASLQTLLKHNQFNAVSAANGKEALEDLNNYSFNLIISDILMPVMDGYLLCQRVKESHKLKNIPFAFYSASYTDEKDEELALSVGADKFIRKPINPDVLIKIIIDMILGANTSGTISDNQSIRNTKETFTLYNERLVKNLESKTLALQKEIRKRKQIYEELKENRELLHNITSFANDGIIVVNNDKEIIYWNNSAEKIFGFTSEEAIREKIYTILPQQKFSEATISCIKNLKKTGQDNITGKHLELLAVKKNGTELPIELSLSSMHIKDKWHVVCIVRDITSRKEIEKEKAVLEAQVSQLHRLESIGTLAGGVAHDFNNILTPILGFVEMSLLELDENSKIYNNLSRVHKAATRAKDLVKQILTFSRSIETNPKPLIIHVIIKEAVKLLRSTLPSTITIEEQIDSDCGYVTADPTKIHQIIMNLCTNARDSMKSKYGSLSIKLEKTFVDHSFASQHHYLKTGNYALITISDTGHGMSKETVKRIFEPFFSTKDIGKGTGLGLSVVYGIVRSCTGEIVVKSKPECGSTFKVYLPLTDGDLDVCQPTKDSILKGKEHILFVDDNEDIITVGKLMLEGLGYDITTNICGSDAIKEFKDNPDKYDLIITDITMPKMTGDQLSIELRSIKSDIPVIFTSGSDPEFTREEKKKIGHVDIILKPFNIQTLSMAIRQALNNVNRKNQDK